MLAILNYHNIAPVPMGMKLPQLYVSPEKFARQLWWLRRVGLAGVSLSEGMRRLNQGDAAGCVALTFDDGYADNVSSAAPILREFGFSATCFVVSDHVGSYNAWDAERLGGRKPLMTREDLGAWMEVGFEIGSHTCSHPDLTALSREAAMEELVNSRTSLSRITGTPVTTFCYPYGRCNSGLAWCAEQAGYQIAVTTRRGRAHAKDDNLLLPRVSVDGRKGLLKFLFKAATGYCDLGFHGRDGVRVS
jgi:peptidoglycan/xylan/chitin deacetylase (PgdA/CDA1 family)